MSRLCVVDAEGSGMPNEEHLAILKKGVGAWKEWRKKNRRTRPNLNRAVLLGANLMGADLRGARLSGANLRGAHLRGAHLVGSDLSEADLSEADLSGADLRSAILDEAKLVEADLSTANLTHANLSEATLIGGKLGKAGLTDANLRGTILDRAKLVEARLIGACLVRAYLNESDLSRAILKEADLSEAHLIEADLRGANLSESNLRGAILRGANFSKTILGSTVLAEVDLSDVKGLEEVVHTGPSTLGIDTIYKSNGKLPVVFLRGCGVPASMITFMHSLVGTAIEFYSCFISYSGKDEDFAKRLHAALQDKGVRVWYAPEDLKIGDKFRSRIDEAIRVYDKLLIVLSESSINSTWVENEVEAAFEKERKEKRTVLFPVRLDDAVMKTNEAWAADIRRTRHIGDMSAWKDHDRYQAAFDRLLRDLKASEV